ncbi:MAG TPA: hypothetical protein VFU07_02885 [Candidatus Lumbricidophila sp.]|nr:hypothetical protein [Candidatus Lumbricidophila sp.]
MTLPLRSRVARFMRAFWVPLVLVAMALGYSGWTLHAHSHALSPVDEWVYSDYLYKIGHGQIPVQGEAIGHDALNLMACNGVKPYGPMGPPCGSDYSDLSKFPFAGITTADAYTPAYFVVTATIGNIFHAVGIDSLTSWRMTGPLWLGGTVFVMWMLMRRWRVPNLAILGLGLAFIASPFSWWTYTYVSTDAPSVLFGALLLLLAHRYVQTGAGWWWIPLISVLAVLFKVTNLLGVGLAALYLIFAWLAEWPRRRWTGWRTERLIAPGQRWLGLVVVAVTAAVLGVVTQLVWLRIHAAFGIGKVADQGIGYAFSKSELISQIFNFLPGTLRANVNISGSTAFALPLPDWSVFPLSWICITGVVGSIWTMTRGKQTNPLVVAVAIASAAFAPALAVALYLTTGAYYQLPPRYGASILAGILLVSGLLLRNRLAQWVVIAYALLLGGVLVAYLPVVGA